jgi:hypothetical protein
MLSCSSFKTTKYNYQPHWHIYEFYTAPLAKWEGARKHYLNHKTKLRDLSPQANYTDRRLLAKLVPTLEERGCSVVSAIPPQSFISVFYTGDAISLK